VGDADAVDSEEVIIESSVEEAVEDSEGLTIVLRISSTTIGSDLQHVHEE
jgi:hypothetical protein